MANQLVKAADDKMAVEYESGGQAVKLSANTVAKYLVNGNGNVNEQEIMMFLSLCKYQKLNPFLKEAYLIKYGNQPATIVTSKEALMKRAARNPAYMGHTAGITVINVNGEYEERVGGVYVKGDEDLVGGWAEVFIKGWEKPLKTAVSFGEYCLYKDGKPASNWATKPATMIRKVALAQALREAFPEDLGGMYAEEETGVTPVMDVENVEPATPAEPEPAPIQRRRPQSIKPQPVVANPANNDNIADFLFG